MGEHHFFEKERVFFFGGCFWENLLDSKSGKPHKDLDGEDSILGYRGEIWRIRLVQGNMIKFGKMKDETRT